LGFLIDQAFIESFLFSYHGYVSEIHKKKKRQTNQITYPQLAAIKQMS